MIKQLIKYLWNRYVVMPPTEKPDIIALADQMESRHECQTLQIKEGNYVHVGVQGPSGGYFVVEYGPCRVIIVKENRDVN